MFPLLVGIGALALLSLGLQLFLESSRLRKAREAPPPWVKACVWEGGRRQENTPCRTKCGPVYAADEMPLQQTLERKTYSYCCPKGYTVNLFTGPSAVCKRI